MPDSYFKYADLAGLLYQNPQLRDRAGGLSDVYFADRTR